MPSLSLESYNCSPDENGNQQRLSIDASSSKRWTNVTTYKARRFSCDLDPRHRSPAIAKFSNLRGTDSASWARCELEKAQIVKDLAEKFNHYVRHVSSMKPPKALNQTECEVSFLRPQMGSVDRTSFLDRKRKEGDKFVFEDDLGRASKFMDEEGTTSLTSANAKKKASKKRRQIMEAPSAGGSANSVSRSILIPSERGRQNSVSSLESDSPPSYDESNRMECLIRLERISSVSSIDIANNNAAYCGHNSTQPGAPLEYETVWQNDIMERTFESVQGRDEKPNSVDIENPEDDGRVSHPLLQAYVHFFFCQTEGKSIVCNLKGSRENNNYTLTTPVVHSLEHQFGDRDDGPSAVYKVVANHKCTWLCRQLPDMFTLLTQALTDL